MRRGRCSLGPSPLAVLDGTEIRDSVWYFPLQLFFLSPLSQQADPRTGLPLSFFFAGGRGELRERRFCLVYFSCF